MSGPSIEAIGGLGLPADRPVEVFYPGQKIFIPRASGMISGYTESSLATVIAVKAYEGSDLDLGEDYGQNPSTGYIHALAGPKNPISSTYFVGDVDHAGIVPVEQAATLVKDKQAQDEWIEGAQWPKDEDWQGYVRLLQSAVKRMGLTHPNTSNPGRHAHRPARLHRPVIYNARLG